LRSCINAKQMRVSAKLTKAVRIFV
jgi:hypothetical protein